MPESVTDRVRDQYPMFSYLLDDREVGPLLRQLVDPGQERISPQRFTADLMATNWYRTKSVAARQYEMMRNNDPGEFRSAVGDYSTAIRMEADRLGVRLTSNEVKYMANAALRNGWSTSDPRISQGVGRIRRRSPDRVQYGAIRSAARDSRSVANNEYFVSLPTSQMWHWADKIARGQRTEADLRTRLSNMAESRYPHLKNQLRAGNTMQDMFGGHIETIAETLELNPTDIQPWKSNSKWRTITGISDPKSGRDRAMTLAETERLARSDNRFWKTQGGRQQDAGMAQFLAQQFGERK